MIPTTLTEGLERYQIGAKVRALRLRRKIGLQELARQSGMSSGMLSKIERGRLFPTLPTLFKIAVVFGVGLDHFFAEDTGRPNVAIVRRRDHVRPSALASGSRPASPFVSLDFAIPNRKLDAYYAEFEPVPAEEIERHSHAGAEFVYVFEGQLVVAFDGVEHVLDAGDAIYFDSDRLHSYQRRGTARCTAVVVTTV